MQFNIFYQFKVFYVYIYILLKYLYSIIQTRNQSEKIKKVIYFLSFKKE